MTEGNIARRDIMNNLSATSALPDKFDEDNNEKDLKDDFESSRASQQQIPRLYNF